MAAKVAPWGRSPPYIRYTSKVDNNFIFMKDMISVFLAIKLTFCVGFIRQSFHPGPAGPGYFSGGQRPHCKCCLSFYRIVNKLISVYIVTLSLCVGL